MWYDVPSQVGLVQVLNSKFGAIDRNNSLSLPDFAGATALVGASDYSGEHSGSAYHVFSFIVTSDRTLAGWDQTRQLLRHQHRLDTRRMAYAKLGDESKARALSGFLAAADLLESVICSVAINKRIKSVFDSSGRIDLKEWGLESWRHWRHTAFEKLLRVTHLAAFLFAGFAAPHQNIIWITDEDAIAANERRLGELTNQFMHVLNRYTTHKLGHARCATTAADTGFRDVEDLAAIPDLIGGALADLLTALSARGARISDRFTLPQPDHLPGKATQILSWLANRRRPPLAFVVEEGKQPGQIEITDIIMSPHTFLYTPPRLGD